MRSAKTGLKKLRADERLYTKIVEDWAPISDIFIEIGFDDGNANKVTFKFNKTIDGIELSEECEGLSELEYAGVRNMSAYLLKLCSDMINPDSENFLSEDSEPLTLAPKA